MPRVVPNEAGPHQFPPPPSVPNEAVPQQPAPLAPSTPPIPEAPLPYRTYILQSIRIPSLTYVGYTHLPVSQRLTRHNEGAVPSTANHRPWRLAFACAFPNKQQALDFERYLKSHSGKAFTAKHLL